MYLFIVVYEISCIYFASIHCFRLVCRAQRILPSISSTHIRSSLKYRRNLLSFMFGGSWYLMCGCLWTAWDCFCDLVFQIFTPS